MAERQYLRIVGADISVLHGIARAEFKLEDGRIAVCHVDIEEASARPDEDDDDATDAEIRAAYERQKRALEEEDARQAAKEAAAAQKAQPEEVSGEAARIPDAPST